MLDRFCPEDIIKSKKMEEKRLKYNIEKYLFVNTKMEYLFFWVKRDGVKPIVKIQAIKIWSHQLLKNEYITL